MELAETRTTRHLPFSYHRGAVSIQPISRNTVVFANRCRFKYKLVKVCSFMKHFWRQEIETNYIN